MKTFRTFENQIATQSNILKNTIAFILTLAVLFSTASFSLANQVETSQLMRHAAGLSQSGKNKEALKIFLEITREEPNNFYAYNNLGMVHSEMQENDKAQQELE